MASFVFLLFLLFLQSAAASDLISEKSGENVILTCQADGGSITAVKWTRTDLKSEYVLFHRDGQSDPTNQQPFFKGRVQLVDSDLKDGDVSLILKNVNMNDTGTYECRVATGSSKLQKDPIRRFRLEVAEEISVKSGDDVILSCQAVGGSIRAVNWTRTEPSPAEDIYKDGRPVSQNFEGRVQLVDSDLKKGNMSLILKNVNMDDAGTYECRVSTGSSRRRKRAISDPDLIRRFRLEVTDSGEGDKHDGLAEGDDVPHRGPPVGTVVCVVGLVVVVGALVAWRSKRCREQRSNPPAADEAVNVDLL